MRKTLEIIALVLTIVASLVAIIEFVTGRVSLPAFLFTSAGHSPAVVPTPTPPPTTATSPSSSGGVDQTAIGNIYVVFYGAYALILGVISWIMCLPATINTSKKKNVGCGNGIVLFFVGFAPLLIPALVFFAINLLFYIVCIGLFPQLLSISEENLLIFILCLVSLFIGIPIILVIVNAIKNWIINFG